MSMASKKKRELREKRIRKGLFIALFVVIILSIGVLAGFYGGVYYQFTKGSNLGSNSFSNNLVPGDHVAIIKVPAVDNDGNGTTTDLLVKVEEGSGRTLVDINTLLFWVDTQNSIRMAKNVAENITGINLNDYDITYAINANASLIGGESAGAALTIATIAAIEDKELKDDVLITGTINHDGSLGPIGGVLEKAEGAKKSGATTFLVPLLQGQEIVYEEKEHCEKFGFMEWCNIERVPKKVDISQESGIDVIEVGSIREALNYFYSE